MGRVAKIPQPPWPSRQQLMRSVNPAYVPRNHLVEAMIRAAVEADDFGPFAQMLRVLSKPYEEQPGAEAYAMPPITPDPAYRTFCGT